MRWNYLSIPKLQRLHRWSLWIDKEFHSIFFWVCDYLSMMGLKFNHVSKRGPPGNKSQITTKKARRVHNSWNVNMYQYDVLYVPLCVSIWSTAGSTEPTVPFLPASPSPWKEMNDWMGLKRVVRVSHNCRLVLHDPCITNQSRFSWMTQITYRISNAVAANANVLFESNAMII